MYVYIYVYTCISLCVCVCIHVYIHLYMYRYAAWEPVERVESGRAIQDFGPKFAELEPLPGPN